MIFCESVTHFIMSDSAEIKCMCIGKRNRLYAETGNCIKRIGGGFHDRRNFCNRDSRIRQTAFQIAYAVICRFKKLTNFFTENFLLFPLTEKLYILCNRENIACKQNFQFTHKLYPLIHGSFAAFGIVK